MAYSNATMGKPVGRYEEKTTGKIGCLVMMLFWGALVLIPPTRWLTIVYLIATLGVLKLMSLVKKWAFGSIVFNNDWVCPVTFVAFVITTTAAWLNPLVPQGWFGGLFSGKLVDSAFWATINTFFFREWITSGWRWAALTYLFAFFPISFFVSYLDEMWEGGKKILAEAVKSSGGKDHGHAHGGGLGSIFKHEIIGELMLLPFKVIGKRWFGIGH